MKLGPKRFPIEPTDPHYDPNQYADAPEPFAIGFHSSSRTDAFEQVSEEEQEGGKDWEKITNWVFIVTSIINTMLLVLVWRAVV